MNDKDYKLTVDVPIELYAKYKKIWEDHFKNEWKWSEWMSSIVMDGLKNNALKRFHEHR